MKNKIKIFLRLFPIAISFLKFLFTKNKTPKTSEKKENTPTSYSSVNTKLSSFENRIVLLDYGHGGVDEQGNYTTNGKLHDHGKGKFHDGSVFYEGVFNRLQAKRVAKLLIDKDIPFRFVADPIKDTSLRKRVDDANDIAKQIGKQNCLYVSFHADAFNTQARGFSVFTSPGITHSDVVAEELFKEVSNKMGDKIIMRFDTSDGDHDKEERFFVLTQTWMPAILIEHLFFDNFEDANMLMDEEICDLFAQCTANVIEKWYKKTV